MDYIQLVCYVCGVISCFSGLVLYGHEVQTDGIIITSRILIVIGVILLSFTYPKD